MIIVTSTICIVIALLTVSIIVIDDVNAGFLLIPILVLCFLVGIVHWQIDEAIDDVKQDFLEGKYVKQYTYIDSIKVDSTYVLREDVFKHK